MTRLDAFREVMRRDRVFDFMLDETLPAVDVSHGVLLYVEGLSVSFDGFKALDNLNLYVDDGELRCLIGANGAGKTTLMDVITGKTRPDEGMVYFGQTHNLLNKSEAEIAELGVGRKFQKPTVFEALTVFENLELALRMDKGIVANLFYTLRSDQADLIASVIDTIGLRAQIFQQAGALSHGEKQWLEIGMLLVSEPRLLLVDEPVAGMTAQETESTAELLTGLAGKRTVIVVEHDMAFVRSISREVTVLHQGAVLAEGSMDEIQNNPEVIEVYLGEAP
jgi:urea transport system ATP-binding protein